MTVIKSEKQYGVTKRQIARLLAAIQAAETAGSEVPEVIRKSMIAGVRSQIEELEAELREFENLRNHAVNLGMDSVDEIGTLLVKARIARGLTQAALGEKIGVVPQQIQKYEATDYEGVSLKRLKKIIEALGISLKGQVNIQREVEEVSSGDRDALGVGAETGMGEPGGFRSMLRKIPATYPGMGRRKKVITAA